MYCGPSACIAGASSFIVSACLVCFALDILILTAFTHSLLSFDVRSKYPFRFVSLPCGFVFLPSSHFTPTVHHMLSTAIRSSRSYPRSRDTHYTRPAYLHLPHTSVLHSSFHHRDTASIFVFHLLGSLDTESNTASFVLHLGRLRIYSRDRSNQSRADSQQILAVSTPLKGCESFGNASISTTFPLPFNA